MKRIALILACLMLTTFAFTGCGLTFMRQTLENIGNADPGEGEPPEPPIIDTDNIHKADSMQDVNFRPHIISADEKEENPYRFIDGQSKNKQYSESTDSLMGVVDSRMQPNCKPGSVAETVYYTAQAILDRIIKNDMTEFERVHAIYDWVIYNVQYDYELLEQWKNDQENNTSTIDPNDPAFKMEGAIIDRIAVCDGMSRAFELLCEMEGIVCKWVGGIADSINHAWNKVLIHKPEYVDCSNDKHLTCEDPQHIECSQVRCTDETHRQWYTVDVTHGNLGYGVEKVDNELLSHAHFLISDTNPVMGSRSEDKLNYYPKSIADYGYYETNKITYESSTIDLKIDTVSELESLLTWSKSQSLTGIEFLINFNLKEGESYQGIIYEAVALAGYVLQSRIVLGELAKNAVVFLKVGTAK